MTDTVWTLTLCLLVLAALLVLRRRAPVAFWWLVGYPFVALRVLTTYRATMDACGLTVSASVVRRATARMIGREAAPVPPRRSLPWPTGSGLVMRLRMATGQAPEDFMASADRLRHAWAAHAVHIRPTKPGWLELRLIGWDVLSDVQPARRWKQRGPLTLPLALRDDGRWHVRDFRAVPHELILGATQSGKSVYLRNLVCGLARQRVVLVGVDCKWGVELAPFAPRLSALADTPDRANELLDVLLEEMEARFRLIGLSSAAGPDAVLTSDVWGLPDAVRPVPVVVVVDEVAELFLAASRDDEKRRDAMVTKLIRIAQLGRAAGIYLEVCGQRFGSELGKGATMLRAQLTGRICHRVNDESSANMALADISPEAALAATSIPAERPGVAIVGDSSGGWSRARSPHLTLDEAAAICRDTAALVPELPRLDAFRPAAVAVESRRGGLSRRRSGRAHRPPGDRVTALLPTVGVTASRHVPTPPMPRTGRKPMSRPSIADVSALIADLAALRQNPNRTSAEYAALMNRKADLLERIAARTPGDADAAEVARLARERAESLKSAN